MGNSPDTTKKGDSKSPVQLNAEPPKTHDGDSKPTEAVKSETTNTEPLAPPPRPAPQVSNTPDYFSGNHGLSHETNPFEFSFANGQQVQTPGGTKLPSVAALTSPAGILGTGTTPNFWGGLRSGPLSPAMLSGPQKEDYFSDGHHLRGGFPTPNESSLRSGLTPGGGGSMFPEPSPNSQALFSQLASGGATPTTLDFHRTAMNAAAVQKRDAIQAQPNITSQPQEIPNGMEVKPPMQGHFDQHDANDAANGLFLLAQARDGPQHTNHYTMAPQPMPVHAHPQMQMGGQSSETSPNMGNRNGGSISTNSGRGASEMSGFSDENEQNRPNTRGKGKRNSTQETAPVNGRRKADAPASKGPASKKSKANNGNSMSMEPPSDDEQEENKGDEYHANGKKMTDEEKRKNFLERNRVAALKCRQRKKQWLQNLQQKVEIYTAENDSLNAQLSALRDEVVNLKTILMAHKDCPVSQQQGIAGMGMHQMLEGSYNGQINGQINGQMNPYGMAALNAQQQQQVMAGQGMQRRYS